LRGWGESKKAKQKPLGKVLPYPASSMTLKPFWSPSAFPPKTKKGIEKKEKDAPECKVISPHN